MRIGGIHKGGTANAHYRAILPLLELQQRGHTILWPFEHDYRSLLRGRPDWDLLHIQQFVTDEDLEVVKRLRRQGIAVVWDTDDDTLSVPREAQTIAASVAGAISSACSRRPSRWRAPRT